jgi:hypothetical protein
MNFANVLASLQASLRHITRRIFDASRNPSRYRAPKGTYAYRRASRWLRWFRAADPGYSKSFPASGPDRRTDHAAETTQEKWNREAAALVARQLACADALAEKKRAREARQGQRSRKGVHGEDSTEA